MEEEIYLSLASRQVEDEICLADLLFDAFVLDGSRRIPRHDGRRSEQISQVVIKRQSLEAHSRVRGVGVAVERGRKRRRKRESGS